MFIKQEGDTMQMNAIQSHTAYQRTQDIYSAQKEKSTGCENCSPMDNSIHEKEKNISQDEYIKSDKNSGQLDGIYKFVKDENGNPKILYRDPKTANKSDSVEENKKSEDKPEIEPKSSEKEAEECTANTDKVDREIERLKKEKQQLEKRIRASAGEEQKVKDLEKQLAAIEEELKQKDNNTYRRQNTSFS